MAHLLPLLIAQCFDDASLAAVSGGLARIEDQLIPDISPKRPPEAKGLVRRLQAQLQGRYRAAPLSACRQHDAEQPPERERQHEEHRPDEAGDLPFRSQCRNDPECRACEIKAHQRAEDLALVRSVDIEFEELWQHARRICAIAQRDRNEADRDEQEIDLCHWLPPQLPSITPCYPPKTEDYISPLR